MIDTYSDVLNQTNPFNPSNSLENNVNKYSKYSRARKHKYEKFFEALTLYATGGVLSARIVFFLQLLIFFSR